MQYLYHDQGEKHTVDAHKSFEIYTVFCADLLLHAGIFFVSVCWFFFLSSSSEHVTLTKF